MDPQAGSSFIPKTPVAGSSPRRGMSGLFFALSLLLFLISLAAAGAVFAYGQYLNNAISSKDKSLKNTEAAFDPDSIDTLVRTDQRIKEMSGLLGKHTAPSAIFTLLGDLTLASVQYNHFVFVNDATEEAHIEITGVADSFSSVALQSDQFGASKYLSDVVFSGITINSSGRVDFTVSATVSPAALSYTASLTSEQAPPAPPPVSPAPTAPATSTTQNP